MSEKLALVNAMVAFGEQLDELPATMLDAGVDADIVDFLKPGIHAQRAQLVALSRA